MAGVSVIVCTHNPRPDYLGRVLAALDAQTLPKSAWDLIIVDNASAPDAGPRNDLSWHPEARLIREDVLGLTPARLRGMRESSGTLLVFVDDDNVLDPDFLAVSLQISEQRPFLGAWSGQCRGEFETPPPAWTRRYWGNLVVREFDHDVWSNLPRLAATMPCGAGLSVRREVALHYLSLYESGQRPHQMDRTGRAMLSGGDNDLAACACDVGLGVGLIASLRLTHLIPPERLTLDYLARLAEGIHYSGTLLDHYRNAAVPKRGGVRRLIDSIRRLLQPREHATIDRAAARGRVRALDVLRRSERDT